jgi:hypothetical protein
VSGWKKATAGVAFLAAVMGALPGLAGCESAPVICAGQCIPPFQLSVAFKPGTSPQAVTSELRKCSRGDANVIRVVELPSANGQPRATIYTHSMPRSGRDRLQKCLAAEPRVLGADWPD